MTRKPIKVHFTVMWYQVDIAACSNAVSKSFFAFICLCYSQRN